MPGKNGENMIVLSELAAILPAEQEVEVKDYQGQAAGIPEKYLCLPVGSMHTQAATLVIEIADVDRLSIEEMCSWLFTGKGKESELFRRRFSDEG